MTRTVAQRLEWLAARIAELRTWPDRAGAHQFAHPQVELPWPEARLRLDLGGEALVTIAYADGTGESG